MDSDAAGRARNAQHIDGVDLLRGLAIFFVLMNHVNMRLFLAKIPYTRGLPDSWVDFLVWNGQYGVQIFFAVSGFLITSMSLRRWGRLADIPVRDFYLMRFARIAPLLLLLLAVLSALHSAGLADFIVSPQTGGLGRALLAAVTFHVNVLEARRGYLPGNWDILWSLSVEELFYLFFPWLCWMSARGRVRMIALLAFVILGPFGRTVFAQGNEVWQEYSYLGAMDAIALGCLTALALHGRRGAALRPAWLAGIGMALLIFILGCHAGVAALGLVRNGLDMTLCALGTCLIIAAVARVDWRAPRLLAPLAWMGRHSYELYLTHMFAVFALFDVFVGQGSPLHWVAALFVAVLLLSAMLGAAVARFYSQPLNRFVRRRFLMSG